MMVRFADGTNMKVRQTSTQETKGYSSYFGAHAEVIHFYGIDEMKRVMSLIGDETGDGQPASVVVDDLEYRFGIDYEFTEGAWKAFSVACLKERGQG